MIGGEIYRVTLDGDIKMVAQLEATEVFSLLPRGDGSLLVGCGPQGGFYRLDDQGDETQLGSVFLFDVPDMNAARELKNSMPSWLGRSLLAGVAPAKRS